MKKLLIVSSLLIMGILFIVPLCCQTTQPTKDALTSNRNLTKDNSTKSRDKDESARRHIELLDSRDELNRIEEELKAMRAVCREYRADLLNQINSMLADEKQKAMLPSEIVERMNRARTSLLQEEQRFHQEELMERVEELNRNKTRKAMR